MDYFGADHGYYVRPRVSRDARALAPKLGIRAIGDAELTQMERSLNVGQYNTIPLADVAIHSQIASHGGFQASTATLSPDDLHLKRAYAFISYLYWYVDSNKRLGWLIDRFQASAHLFDPASPRHALLVQVASERFAYCVLEIARSVQAQGGNDLLENARTYLFGGPIEMQEKKRLFELIQKLAHTNEDLDPPWLPEIFELLSRLLQNPWGACDILRHMMAIHLWCAYLGNNTLPKLGPLENVAAIVLVKISIKSLRRLLVSASRVFFLPNRCVFVHGAFASSTIRSIASRHLKLVTILS
jgi:hypothetical protein